MKAISAALLLCTISACAATAPRMNRVSLGMTKPEVIQAMGEEPFTTVAKDGAEFFIYRLSDNGFQQFHGIREEYAIRFTNGRVDAYGKQKQLIPEKR